MPSAPDSSSGPADAEIVTDVEASPESVKRPYEVDDDHFDPEIYFFKEMAEEYQRGGKRKRVKTTDFRKTDLGSEKVHRALFEITKGIGFVFDDFVHNHALKHKKKVQQFHDRKFQEMEMYEEEEKPETHKNN